MLTFVVFGDLHVGKGTVERCCRVLRMVRELAEERRADAVVCTGDFWDLRGTLDVRLVEQVLSEVERFPRLILVPGNHDQVTLDGRVHGMNVFRGLSNVTVATEPILDHANAIAFLPWREVPEEQRALFESVPAGFTVFAHAEVEGALTNSGKRTRGHVPVAVVERARACYLGHYHQRQRLGEHTWYLSSPFELNAGERGQPHGLAVVRTDRVEPEFVDLQGFPRHHRLSLADVEAGRGGAVAAGDIVDLVAPSDELGGGRYRLVEELLAKAGARSVRPRAEVPTEQESGAPAFALTLEQALERYVEDDEGNGGAPVPHADLLAVGRELLSQVPEARRPPPLGRHVDLVRVAATDFCALRGRLELELPEGRALLLGPVRQGKTAVLDAVMWCLYGSTTPRRAGAATTSATLRADDVLHDSAQSCEVSVELSVDERRITVTRSKRRGQGARVSVEGVPEAAGISDQQQVVERAVGLSHALWRACVSLGQGAVGNFVTDADKRRKELLSGLFGLDACPAAQKLARARASAAQGQVERVLRDLVDARARAEVLAQSDFGQQSRAWLAARQQKLEALTALGVELAEKIKQSDAALAGEPQWLESQRAHEQRVLALERQLGEMRPAQKIAALQREFGGLERERAAAERELAKAKERHARMVETGAQNCESCGQPLPEPQREQHLRAAEVEVQNAAAGLQNFEHRLSNAAVALDALNSGSAGERLALESELAESRAALKKCQDALLQFARLRSNREFAQKQIEGARQDYREQQAAVDPFEERARRDAEQLAALTTKISALEAENLRLAEQLAVSEFWVDAFGARGIPATVLRTALYDLEVAANRYLTQLLDGALYAQLVMDEEGDDLRIDYYELCPDGERRLRAYEQLSGGQRRCAELAFSPFALSDLVRARAGVSVGFLALDELTTHLGAEEKQRACELLERLERRSVLVVDHDPTVQGYFGTKLLLGRDEVGCSTIRRV